MLRYITYNSSLGTMTAPEELTIAQSGARIGGFMVLLQCRSRSAVRGGSACCARAGLAGVARALGAPTGRPRRGLGAAWNLCTTSLRR